jgi:hypothetical protein
MVQPMIEAIEQVLRAHAYQGDNAELDWTLTTHKDFARVECATPDIHDTPEDAFTAALALRAALLQIDGWQPVYQARVSVQSEDGLFEWRGLVAVGMEPTS